MIKNITYNCYWERWLPGERTKLNYFLTNEWQSGDAIRYVLQISTYIHTYKYYLFYIILHTTWWCSKVIYIFQSTDNRSGDTCMTYPPWS